MKNAQFILLALAGAVLLSACKVNDPLYCDTDEDCSEYAYCYNQVCILKECKEDPDCLGDRICAQGICQFEKQDCVGEACNKECELGRTRCDPSASSSKVQNCSDNGKWGESIDCPAGQLCGASNPDSCGACNSDQQCAEASAYGVGFICVKGNCVEGDCHNDNDCKVAGQTCGGGEKANSCGGCTQPTDIEFCGNRNCGTVTDFDYCGNSRTVNCGECFGAQTCGGAGMQNICGCPPPPHTPVETATWSEISAAVPIPDSAYDFTSNPGEVLDKNTCLVWKRFPLGDAEKKEWEMYQWEAANKECASLGHWWRLPTKAELDSILDHYKDRYHSNLNAPIINVVAFPDTPGAGFWASSKEEDTAWIVYFDDGASGWWPQHYQNAVRCVR